MPKKDKKQEHETIDFRDEAKRLNRITGQIEGIAKMLKEGRKLDDVLIQCKAVHSALRSIESRVVKIHLEITLNELEHAEKKKARAEIVADLEEIFKHSV